MFFMLWPGFHHEGLYCINCKMDLCSIPALAMDVHALAQRLLSAHFGADAGDAVRTVRAKVALPQAPELEGLVDVFRLHAIGDASDTYFSLPSTGGSLRNVLVRCCEPAQLVDHAPLDVAGRRLCVVSVERPLRLLRFHFTGAVQQFLSDVFSYAAGNPEVNPLFVKRPHQLFCRHIEDAMEVVMRPDVGLEDAQPVWTQSTLTRQTNEAILEGPRDYFADAVATIRGAMQHPRDLRDRREVERCVTEIFPALCRLYRCDGFVVPSTNRLRLRDNTRMEYVFLPTTNDGVHLKQRPFDPNDAHDGEMFRLHMGGALHQLGTAAPKVNDLWAGGRRMPRQFHGFVETPRPAVYTPDLAAALAGMTVTRPVFLVGQTLGVITDLFLKAYPRLQETSEYAGYTGQMAYSVYFLLRDVYYMVDLEKQRDANVALKTLTLQAHEMVEEFLARQTERLRDFAAFVDAHQSVV